MNKLNWGCGSIQPDDWTNVDKDASFYQGKPNFWPGTDKFANESYDIIVAHASLQQVEWHQIVDQLKEFYRLLKPGGIVRISLPDIVAGFNHYIGDDDSWFPNAEINVDDRFSAWLTWYSTSKSLMTEHSLVNKLFEAGFLQVAPSNFGQSIVPEAAMLDTRRNEFFFVEAVK